MNNMIYQQERVKYDANRIIVKCQDKVVESMDVWARVLMQSVNMDTKIRKIIRFLRGVKYHTTDIRAITFKKRTIYKLCNHVRSLYVCQNLSQPGFLEIKLSMDVTEINFNIFDSGVDSIKLDEFNTVLSILLAMDRFKKLNSKKF